MCISLEWKIFWATLGIILYGADILSDLLLFTQYLWQEHYLFAFLTLNFVLAASIITTYRSPRRLKHLPMNSLKSVLICVPIVIFNLELVIEAIQSNRFRLKMTKNYKSSSKLQSYNGKRRLNKVRAAYSKFDETVLEAAPQLTLQVCILLSSTLKGYELNFRGYAVVLNSDIVYRFRSRDFVTLQCYACFI